MKTTNMTMHLKRVERWQALGEVKSSTKVTAKPVLLMLAKLMMMLTAIMDPPRKRNLHLPGSLPRKRLQPRNLRKSLQLLKKDRLKRRRLRKLRPKRHQLKRDRLKRKHQLLLELWHQFEDNPKLTMQILHLRMKRSLSQKKKKKNLNLRMKCQSREERREPKVNHRKKLLLQKRKPHNILQLVK